MNHLSPQCAVIMDHLLRGGSLTALEATRPPFNTTCLHKRLSEIAATGVIIDDEWETDGKKRWKRYSYKSNQLRLRLVG